MPAKKAYQPYLDTLRLIPRDIILSMATREIIPNDGGSCLCGWALREALARAHNKDADFVFAVDYPYDGDGGFRGLRRMFGGTREEWRALYFDVCPGHISSNPRMVELAFLERVKEAAHG